MPYTKTVWDATIPLSQANLQHLETQADMLDAETQAVDHAVDYYTIAEYASTYWAVPGGQAGSDAEYLNGMTKAQILAASIPADSIIMWHGNIASPPSGFLYCNGVGGAPDIRAMLPYGGSSNIRTKAGTSTTAWTGTVSIAGHTLTWAECPAHLHQYLDGPSAAASTKDNGLLQEDRVSETGWTNYQGGGGSHTHSGSLSGSNNNYPLCKAVHFLIKT